MLALCLTLMLLPGTASAASVVASGECGVQGNNLTWTLDDTGALTISGTGAMQDYSIRSDMAPDPPWLEFNAQYPIRMIRFEGKPASIGRQAFHGCSSLTSISIPDSITSIGDFAFLGCTSLTDIVIPNSVTGIGLNTFDGCRSLTSISIPNSITNICGAMFYGCSGLTSVTIPSSVATIEAYAFGYCTSLTSVTIPSSITTIEAYTFENCTSLTDIVIPNSVTYIEEEAFSGCSSLTDIYYSGTKAQWEQITIESGNAPLQSAAIHYADSGDKPVESGKMTDGVKYVPYSCWVEDAASSARPDTPVGEQAHYEITEGSLPPGLDLDKSTGMVSGVPMEGGSTWEFSVRSSKPDGENTADSAVLRRSLTVLDNTDAAVQRPNDYEIIEPVGTPQGAGQNHFFKNDYTEEKFVIDGPYNEFIRLLIDGAQLREPEDYAAEAGSTVITIHAQTFQHFGEGTHTIAAEFRPANSPNGTVKRVAQNYTLNLSASSADGTSTNGSSAGNSGGRSKPSITGTSSPSKPPPEQQPQNQNRTNRFRDVDESDWFYEDVLWAYNEGVMRGIGHRHFDPSGKVSQATIVTVLSRLAKVDLNDFDGETEPDVPAGQYFTAPAIWAKRAGLMPSGSMFTGSEVTTRDQMAIMLAKYLGSMGTDTTPPAQPIAFRDSAEMSREAVEAFQVLYQYKIFKGKGGKRMDPSGSTTRAQLAALIHRVYDTAVG